MVYAPAKINAYLRVVGRRPDGHHLLESIVAPVSVFDRVWLRDRSDGEIRLKCSDPELPAQSDNLAWRAAALLQKSLSGLPGVEIRLYKRIPAGAGLGGGSSDAAAVLVGLNQLWGLGLPTASLAKMGSHLGADVPFFVHAKPAVMRGVGERIRPLQAFPHSHLVLVWPGFGVETRWVYQNLRWSAPRARPASPVRRFLQGRLPLASILQNDLEPVATRAHPQIAGLRVLLEGLGACGVSMTGSGSAVFGLFSSGAAARRAAAGIRRGGLWAVAACTIERAPSPVARNPLPSRRIR